MAKCVKVTFPLTQPYNLGDTLFSGQAFRWSLENPSDPKVNYQGIIYGRRVSLIQEQQTIIAKITLERTDPISETDLRDLVGSYLRIDDDLESFYARSAADEYLQSSIDQYKGLHLLRQEPWECLVTFICSANNNIPRIRLLVDRISKACGKAITDSQGTYYSFPPPGEIAMLGESGLRELGLGFRAKYVNHAAQAISRGEINLENLRESEYEETYQSLISLYGVGDKVANCVMLFSLDQDNSFPVDVWIRRVLREKYVPNGEAVPEAQLRIWAQNKFGIDSGYVNQYLFQRRRLERKT